MRATFTHDPEDVLAACSTLLRSRPVEHNLVLTLLTARASEPSTEGRYGWVESVDGVVSGVYFHSPLTRQAVLSPMGASAAALLAAQVVRHDPGVRAAFGEASTVAAFAGAWADAARAPAEPAEAVRLYQLQAFTGSPDVNGRVRLATPTDHDWAVKMRRAFSAELGVPAEDDDRNVARLTAAGRLWVCEHDGERAGIVGATNPAAGVARVATVYTRPEHRGTGVGTAGAAAATKALLDEGSVPVLFGELSNPTANGIYRRLGYRPIQELVAYRLALPAQR